MNVVFEMLRKLGYALIFALATAMWTYLIFVWIVAILGGGGLGHD